MKQTVGKILNQWVLLAINVIIILVTEMSGEFFMQTGIVHLIAILFIMLGVSQLFVHYHVHDAFLLPLIRSGSIALLIFSASHVVEFLSIVYFKTYTDAVFVNVANFYMISMFAVMIGAEYFLRKLNKKPAILSVEIAGLIIFLLYTTLIFLQKVHVSLELEGITPYIYGIVILAMTFFGVSRLVAIRKRVTIMIGYINYFIAAFILVACSAQQYIFYDFQTAIGVPSFQIIYVSHFLFYGALTFIFLSFERLTHLGGVYAAIEAYEGGHTREGAA